MLNSYERQTIAQTICDSNGYVKGFRNVDIYINWLKHYTKASYVINTLRYTNRSMGSVTADFIMHCKESSNVISFTKKILINLKRYGDILGARGDIKEQDDIDHKINDLNGIIIPYLMYFQQRIFLI